MPTHDNPLVGRGLEHGAALFRDWFTSLDDVAARGEKAAYVFVMGSLAELLRSFDIPVVFPEINSLQTAVPEISSTSSRSRPYSAVRYEAEPMEFGFCGR